MREPSRPSFAFGPFVLDPGKRLLLRDGDHVPLPPKVLDTLLALVEHRRDVISKEQLLSWVWGDTVIEEGGLARNISLLRKALGERPDEHRYIVTVPARGYRFVADVREGTTDPQPQQETVAREATIDPSGESLPSSFALRRKSAARWRTIGVISLIIGASAALVWVSRSSSMFRTDPLPNPRLIRLTSTSGLNTDSALSPDGRLVAYASDRARTGTFDIWVQPVHGDTPTRITLGEGDEVEPSFSPDGSLIAFSGGETGGIYTVGALGGDPHLIVRGARTRTPRFSPDGRSILYWVGQTAWVIIPGRSTPGATGTLAVVPSSGGTPRPLASDYAGARYGVWSPDGKKILFVGERAGDAEESLDWYVIDLEGGGAVRSGALQVLRAAQVKGAPIPGAWTAEGVMFTTTDETASNVWQLPVSPQTGHVAGSAKRLTFGTAIERSAAVSTTGRIAFTALTENVDVWRVPLDSQTGAASGAPERVTDEAALDTVFNVSADGRTLAFESTRTGRKEVWLKDLQTGAERQLTHSGASGARIAPDGRRIAVQRQGETRIELYDASGGQPSTLCDDCMLNGDGWSSDSSRLLIGRRRGSTETCVMLDVNSRRKVEITNHPHWNIMQAHFSPDDRWVTFHTSNAPNLRQVYAVAVDFHAPVPAGAWVAVAPDFGIYPNWSSDGAGIYYFSFRDGYMCAWLQAVDPSTKHPIGPPRPVQHFHQPRLRAAARARASSSVSNGALYVTLTETTGNIWTMDPTKRSW
jgi:eukaryotic-like serine/threonine-protein kinase